MSDPVSADGRRHKSEVAAARRRVTISASIGLLLLRLGFGALLVIRGLQHARDIDGFTAMIRQAHVPFPVPVSVAAWITTVGELGLGILLAVGFLTRVAGGLVAVLMGLVYVSWHVPRGNLLTLSQAVGVEGENALTIGLVGLVLVFTGPGRFAVDAGFRRGRGVDVDDVHAGSATGPPARQVSSSVGQGRPADRGSGVPGRSKRDQPLPDDPKDWTDADIERL